MNRPRSNAIVPQRNGLDASLVSQLLNDAYGKVSANRGKWHVHTRLAHWTGHKVSNALEYSIKHKFYNEKGMTAISLGISAPIVAGSVVGSIAIAGATKGIATPFALAGLAAGVWGAQQVADAVTELIRNQYRQERMRRWFDDYPIARQEIQGTGAKLLLIQDACDSIRRAVDHYRKAGEAGRKAAEEIMLCEYGKITNCSEVVGLLKRQMKFMHEVRKTELYLVPCLDLAIYLRNTQRHLCQQWADCAPQFQAHIAKHLLTGDHGKCGDTCYRPQLGGSAPRKPLTGGNADLPGGVLAFGQHATKLQEQLDELLKVREQFGTDLRAKPSTQHYADAAVQRFTKLVEDSALHYNKAGLVKRTRHYVRNAWTRRTKSELVMGAVNRGTALYVGMATAAGGNAFTSGVLTPGITAPINESLKISNALTTKLGSMTSSLVNKSVFTTYSTGIKLGTIVTGVVSDKVMDKVSDEDEKNSNAKMTEKGRDVGDNLFKKSVRHLQQAYAAFENFTQKPYPLDSCKNSVTLAKDIGEFVWHLGKSMRYLDKSLQLVTNMAGGVMQWNEAETELWPSVENVALKFLDQGCASCACHENGISALQHFKVCYGPGQSAGTPRRRM